MKKMKLAGVVVAGIVLSGCMSATKLSTRNLPEIQPEKRKLVAIVDFQNKTSDSAYDSMISGITGNIINELQKTKSVRIIERQRLTTILDELKLNVSDLVDSNKAKEAGKLLGVDAFLFGNLSSIKYSHNKQTILVMWTEAEVVEVSLDARLVDTVTGEILATSKSNVFVKQRNWVAFWFARLGNKIDKNSVVQTGIELSIKQLVNELVLNLKQVS